jgi:CO dehydrogenase nickel-insertion accessory protein CooC1
LLGELDVDGGVLICDLEAGVGTVLRMLPGQVDVVLVIAEPTVKSIEVARRAAQIGSGRARVVVVANRVRGEADVEVVRAALGDHELAVVPDEPAIQRADEDGVAPLDAAPESAGVRAIVELAERLVGS